MASPTDPALRVYLDKIKKLEDNIPYMYMDTTGNVTVGLGHNLTAHKDQTKLPFKVKRFERHSVLGGDTGIAITTNQVVDRAATVQEIQNDYDFLIKHKGLGKYTVASGKLQKYTTVELDQTAINALFESDLKDAIDQVNKVFGAALDTFPVPCQAALIDLQFNTGNVSKFTTVVRAAKGEGEFAKKSASERWNAAANACNRPQVNAERNTLIPQWFRDGANLVKGK